MDTGTVFQYNVQLEYNFVLHKVEMKKRLERLSFLYFVDCLAIRYSGRNVSGVYNITPGDQEITTRCDMDTEEGGWTVK